MSPKRVFSCALSFVLALLSAAPAWSCPHPPVRVEVSMTQTGQRGLVYHDGQTQHLVMSAAIEADGQLPELAWLLPVPAPPEDYGTADAGLFEALASAADMKVEYPLEPPKLSAGPAGPGDDSTPSLVEMQTSRVGPYDITPLKARGSRGGEALRKWLDEHGFRQLPDDRAHYYIDRDWMFLAVKIAPSRGSEAIEDGSLPPLRVSFPSERIVYPLKLEAGTGEFPVQLFVLTPEPIPPADFRGAQMRGFYVAGAREVDFSPDSAWSEVERRGAVALPSARYPSAWPAGQTDVPQFSVAPYRLTPDHVPQELAELVESFDGWPKGDSPRLYLRVLFAPNFNDGFADPTEWREDLSIPGVKPGERLTGQLPTAPAAGAKVREEEAGEGGCAAAGGEGGPFSGMLVGLVLIAGPASGRRTRRGS